ncbi:MAG: hypothetical protein V4721_10365 [Bacteroidota bacterium]
MNYLSFYLDFKTVEQGQDKLRLIEKLRDRMIEGSMLYDVLSADYRTVEDKLNKLIRRERKK